MSVMDIPNEVDTKTVTYGKFKGTDVSNVPLFVAGDRASYSMNMIAGEAGLPEKRMGYKTLFNLNGRINGIHQFNKNGEKIFVVHCGETFYKVLPDTPQSTPVLLYSGVNNDKSTSYSYPYEGEILLFIMTGENIYFYDGEEVHPISDRVEPPLVHAENGLYEVSVDLPANMLSPTVREEWFVETDHIKKIKLTQPVDLNYPIDIQMNIYHEGYDYDIMTTITDFTFDELTGSLVFNEDLYTFCPVEQRNTFVTYHVKDISPDYILKSRHFAFYGPEGENRLFVTGNADYPACDWMSLENNPFYFENNSTVIFGDQNNPIVGYSKIGDDLMIIKGDTLVDTSVYLRTYSQKSDGSVDFEVTPGVSGSGAISPYAFGILQDEPLFLSNNGVLAVSTRSVTAERPFQNRSFYLDRLLLAEENLKEAHSAVWKSFYLLAVGEHVYVWDSRQKSDGSFQLSEFIYEGYIWDNINARYLLVTDGELYFGTEDGRVAKFSDDSLGEEKYMDDDAPISAVWQTKDDDDDLPVKLKTLQKKGGILHIEALKKTSAIVEASTDGDGYDEIGRIDFNRFDFDDFDFDFLSFSTEMSSLRYHFNTKIKNYTSLSFKISNAQPREGLSIYEICKTFTESGFTKKEEF